MREAVYGDKGRRENLLQRVPTARLSRAIFAMSSAADRQRSYRERQRRGEIVVAVAIDDVTVAEALVAHGFLAAGVKDDRQSLARAIERLIEAMVARDA